MGKFRICLRSLRHDKNHCYKFTPYDGAKLKVRVIDNLSKIQCQKKAWLREGVGCWHVIYTDHMFSTNPMHAVIPQCTFNSTLNFGSGKECYTQQPQGPTPRLNKTRKF